MYESKCKLVIYFIILFVTMIYLMYRIAFSIPFDNVFCTFFAILIIIVEFIDAFFFFEYYINYLILKKNSPVIPKIKRKDFPHVDVFIATINEDLSLIEKNVIACKKIKYYDKTKMHIYVCDDGRRDDVKKLCSKYNVGYITRENNVNFKAGNYNNALNMTSSPYILTLDVDMIPKSDILLKTIPFFVDDDRVGLVQTPQSFENCDIFQMRFKLFNRIPFEQDYFYKKNQLTKNYTNSVVYCGTNAVLSRDALESIGGFATQSVTEDIVTGMLIEAAGYKGVAINEVLAVGQNVNDLKSFIKQRRRWCRGSIQMLKNYPIIKNKGLNWKQKLEYISSIYYWFFGFRTMFYLLVPLLFCLLNIKLINGSITIFLSLFIVQYLLKRFVIDIIEKNNMYSTWNRIYEIILFPVIFMEVFKELFFKREKKFDVTIKNKIVISKIDFSLLFFHFAFLVVSLFGFIVALFKGYLFGFEYYIVSIFWLIINVFYLIIAIIFDLSLKNSFNMKKVNDKKCSYNLFSIFLIFKNYLFNELNIKRVLVSCFVLFVSLIFGFKLFKEAELYVTPYVSENGWLSVENETIINEHGEEFILRGISSHNLYWFDYNYNYNNLKELSDWGVNTFRIAIYTSPLEEGYIKNKNLKEKIINIIDICIKLKMYVIVDWHILKDNTPSIYEKEAIEFFDEISERYGDVPNVIYEICNEPNGDDVTWNKDIKPYAEKLIKTIRENSSDSLIIVGTANWSKDIDSVVDDPINEDNIIYSVHTYPDRYIYALQDKMNNALENNIPIIVTECAPTDPSGSDYLFFEFFEEWVQYLEDNNISWMIWQFSDKDELSSILLSEDNKYISLNNDREKIEELKNKEYSINDYLSETGIYVKKLFEKYSK